MLKFDIEETERIYEQMSFRELIEEFHRAYYILTKDCGDEETDRKIYWQKCVDVIAKLLEEKRCQI